MNSFFYSPKKFGIWLIVGGFVGAYLLDKMGVSPKDRLFIGTCCVVFGLALLGLAGYMTNRQMKECKHSFVKVRNQYGRITGEQCLLCPKSISWEDDKP